MRRLALVPVVLAALAVPLVALATPGTTSDGSLVIQNGQAPAGTPVVAMTITGSVIGNIGHGKLVVDAGPNSDVTPQVIGYESHGDSTLSDTASWWRGFDVKFRVIGCNKCTLLVYGSDDDDIDLVAVGQGTVKVAGMPDTPHGDGSYSLNDHDFVSLPGVQSKLLSISAGG